MNHIPCSACRGSGAILLGPWTVLRYVTIDKQRVPSAYSRAPFLEKTVVYATTRDDHRMWHAVLPSVTVETAEEAMAATDALIEASPEVVWALDRVFRCPSCNDVVGRAASHSEAFRACGPCKKVYPIAELMGGDLVQMQVQAARSRIVALVADLWRDDISELEAVVLQDRVEKDLAFIREHTEVRT